MGQDAGIYHQQFLLGTRFATEHEPTEAHLGIDLEQQLEELRVTIAGLEASGLTGEKTRIGLEKPLGSDLKSSREWRCPL